MGDDLLHLSEGQYPWQHGPLDAELCPVQVDGLVAGGGPLHGQVQPQFGMDPVSVGHQPGVGKDQGIDAEFRRTVDRSRPVLPVCGLGIGVERQQYFAPAFMGIAHAFAHGFGVEVQAGEVARIGGVLEAQVDTVCAIVDRRLERRQAACRADQFDGEWSCHEAYIRSSKYESPGSLVKQGRRCVDPCQNAGQRSAGT